MRYEDQFTSQMIQAVAYDEAGQWLYAFFAAGGSVYGYEGVPPSVLEAFLSAPSKGRYFREHIRSGFRAVRLTPAERRTLEERIAASQGASARAALASRLGCSSDGARAK